MAFNPYIGWSLADIESEIRSLQEQLHRIIVRSSAGDADVSFAERTGVETAMERLYRAAYALDPDKYPIDQITRVDRTRATFRQDNYA